MPNKKIIEGWRNVIEGNGAIALKEQEMIIKALQTHINNPYVYLSYEELRDYSDLKERLKAGIRINETK